MTLYSATLAPVKVKFQNKLLYSASIGGGAHRAKPQSPHMYQAVRDPRSNLHFNACLSSIITSGTAWLNFTDAYRRPCFASSLALLAWHRLGFMPLYPLRRYTVLSCSLIVYCRYLSLSLARARKPCFVPLARRTALKKSQADICGGSFNYIIYTQKVFISLRCAVSLNKANRIIISRQTIASHLILVFNYSFYFSN